MWQSEPEQNGQCSTDDQLPGSMRAGMSAGWLGELAGLAVPAEDAEPLADALERLGQLLMPLIARVEPGTCMTGDFDPRWP